MPLDVFTIEVVAVDPNLGATHPLTLYYATRGFATRPAETPANTHFDGRLKQPFIGPRTLFGSGTTKGRSTTGYGDVELNNGDGLLDALADYAVDGQAITIRHGTVGAAYPSGFTTVLVATMAGVEATQDVVRIKLRDRQAELNKPLQTTKYAGDNVLPAGLEGVEDLKGKPKPLCFGKVLNVPAVCVNTSKLIYQVNDGAIASLDGVYDRGVNLIIGRKWVETATGGADDLYAACQVGGTYIVGGAAGALYTSTDLISWTSRTSTFGASTIRAFAVYGDTVVAVGDGGKIATSTNAGASWTSQTSGTARNFAAVTAGSSAVNFIAVAASGGVSDLVYSADLGLTWVGPASFTTDTAVGVAFVPWNAGGEIAVVTSKAGNTGGVWRAAISAPLVLGADSPYATTAVVAQDIVADPASKTVIIVTDSGGVFTSSYANFPLSLSYPFPAFTSRTSGLGTSVTLIGVAVDNAGSIVAVSSSAGAGSTISQDHGETWEVMPTVLETGTVKRVRYGNNNHIAVGTSGKIATTTPAAATYASAADLQDDTLAPAPGTYKVYLAGGYFRLGASPAGLITADVTQGATAADRYPAQLFEALLTRAGMSGGDYSGSDITALDGIAPYVSGFWTDQETDYGSVLDQVAGSVGASWYVDQTGVFRILQLVPASGAPVVSFTKHDLLKPLVRLQTNDQGQGLPAYKVIVRYARNYIIQPVDVAAGVTDARRAVIGKEWLEAQYTDSSVQTTHPLAIQIVDDSLLAIAADALAEATRRQTMRGIARYPFELVVPWTTENEAIDLGDVIQLTHQRYGLYIVGDEDTMTYSPLFTVLGISPDAAQRQLTLTVWGPTHLAYNRITAEGEYRVDSDGNYRIVVAA